VDHGVHTCIYMDEYNETIWQKAVCTLTLIILTADSFLYISAFSVNTLLGHALLILTTRVDILLQGFFFFSVSSYIYIYIYIWDSSTHKHYVYCRQNYDWVKSICCKSNHQYLRM
jgi:hypothetical protein